MNTKHITCGIALVVALAGCEGNSDGKSSTIVVNVPQSTSPAVVVTDPGGIVNTPLPIVETFDEASDIYDFYSASYKSLATESGPGQDNFYYSIAGLFSDKVDNYGEPNIMPQHWLTQTVGATGDKAMRLGSSRFTLGQTVSDLASPDEPHFDQRQKSSPGSAPDRVSWGELDLSKGYTVSFCLLAVGGNLAEKMQIYVDNNQSNKGGSVWGDTSLILDQLLSEMAAQVGKRVTATSTDGVGSDKSYIQIRAEDGGWFALDDLVVETAANPAPDSAKPDCAPKAASYVDVNPYSPDSSGTSTSSSTSSSSSSSSSASSSSSSSSGAVSSSSGAAFPPATPTTAASSATWNVLNGNAKPTDLGALTTAAGAGTEFTLLDEPNDFFSSSADGTMVFDSSVGAALKGRVGYNGLVGDGFPKTYTMLARIRNTNNMARGIEIEQAFGGSDGAAEPKAGRIKLIVRESKVQLEQFNDTKDGTLEVNLTTTDWHIYQLVTTLTAPREATVSLFVDGVAIIDAATTTTLRTTSVDQNRITLGDGGGNVYNAEVDWLVWTTDDAYLPSHLVGNLPAGLGDITGYEAAPSAAPEVKWEVYNGDAVPTAATALTLDDGTNAAFEDLSTNADATWAVDSGIASFVSTDPVTKSIIGHTGIVSDDATYPKTFTFVSRMRNSNNLMDADTTNDNNRGIEIEARFGGDDGVLGAGRVKFLLRESKIQLEKYGTVDGAAEKTLEANFDTTAYHTYQFNVTLTDVRSATVNTWVDGVPVDAMSGVAVTDLRNTTAGSNRITFGDGSDGNLFNADIDWAVWSDDGAFTPADLTGQLPSGLGDTTGY